MKKKKNDLIFEEKFSSPRRLLAARGSLQEGEENIYIYIIHQKNTLQAKHFTSNISTQSKLLLPLQPLVQSISFLLFFLFAFGGLFQGNNTTFYDKNNRNFLHNERRNLKVSFSLCSYFSRKGHEMLPFRTETFADVLLCGDQSKINSEMWNAKKKSFWLCAEEWRWRKWAKSLRIF